MKNSTLLASLVEAIDKWMVDNCESDAWVSMHSYVGNNISENMASAAFSVLEAVVDIQDYLKEDGQLDSF